MAVYESFWQTKAKHRFPLSGRFLYGDGKFALVSHCKNPWRVLLFSDSDARQTKLDVWARQSCCNHLDCFGQHELIDLTA
jgi:hypothetical protein